MSLQLTEKGTLILVTNSCNVATVMQICGMMKESQNVPHNQIQAHIVSQLSEKLDEYNVQAKSFRMA